MIKPLLTIIILLLTLPQLATAQGLGGSPFSQREEVIISDEAETPSDAVNTENEAVALAETQDANDEEARPSDFPSLLFLPKDVALISKAEQARDTNVPIEILLPDLFGPRKEYKPVERPRVEQEPNVTQPREDVIEYVAPEPELNPADTPIIFLKSILYLSDDNWSVWVNDMKITSSDESYIIADMDSDGIEIISVEPKRILARWSGFPRSLVRADIENHAIATGENMYASQGGQAVYDKTNTQLVFSLETHQAFIPFLLQVVEGEMNARNILFKATNTESELYADSMDDNGVADDETMLENVKPNEVKPTAADRAEQQNTQKNIAKQIRMLEGLLNDL